LRLARQLTAVHGAIGGDLEGARGFVALAVVHQRFGVGDAVGDDAVRAVQPGYLE